MSRSGHCATPRSVRSPNLSQKGKNTRAHKGALSRTPCAHDQDKWPFRNRLFFQCVQHFADYFRPAVKNRCMFKIKELQAAIRIRLPVLPSLRTFPRDDFAFQLLCEESLEMLTKQLLEFLQVVISTAGFRKRTSSLPNRKKFLYRIPLLEGCFPFFFRLKWRYGSRSVAVNVQLGESGSSICLIQHPGDFVLSCRGGLATIRHNERRGNSRSEPRPENTNDEIILTGVRNAFSVVLLWLEVLILPEAGTEQRSVLLEAICA